MDGRLLGLLLVVTVMTTGARWLHSEESDALEAPAEAAETPGARPPPALQRTSLGARAAAAPATPAPKDIPEETEPRPASAELCLALQDKLRALYLRASGEGLAEPELLALRSERRKAQAQLVDLRCSGGARAWF